MRSAVLSLKPVYAQMVLAGQKRYELRKYVFRKPVQKIYVYVTKPVGKVIFSFRPGKILIDEPLKLWQSIGYLSGLSKKEFLEYFGARKIGVAIEIKDVVVFGGLDTPEPQFQLPGRPPQSWAYFPEQRQLSLFEQ